MSSIVFFNDKLRIMNETVPRQTNRLKQLRAFCMAAKTGSFSKAGELLLLSQPSISLQIQALESELDTELFKRNGPKIHLTEAGRKMLELAQPLVEQMDSLPSRFLALHNAHETGEINIAAGEASILYVLPKIIELFRQRHPGIHIRLHNVSGLSGLNALRDGTVDFAVGPMLEIPGDMIYQSVYNFVPVLIMPFSHPLAKETNITLEKIAEYDLILPPKFLNTWRIVDDVFQKHNINYTGTLEAGGWEILKKYVELGLGISIITSICLTGEEKLIAKPLTHYFPNRSYGVIMQKEHKPSIQAKNFIEIIDPEFFKRTEHK